MNLWVEAKRKAVHLLGLLIPLGYILVSRDTALILLTLLLATGLALEFLRLNGLVSLPLVRAHEERRVAAYVYTGLASLLSIALFPKPVAILSLFYLGIGDTTGALVGLKLASRRVDGRIQTINDEPTQENDILRALRRRKPNRVLASVFLACLTTGLITRLLYPLPLLAIALGAMGAALADGVPWQIRGHVFDDNLTIPLLSGALMLLA